MIKTVEKVAAEQGIGKNTVVRAEKFADGLDNMSNQYPEIKQEVLSGKSDWTKQEIQSLAKAEPERVQEAVEQKQKPHVAHMVVNLFNGSYACGSVHSSRLLS